MAKATPDPDVAAHCHCFEALARVVEAILRVGRSADVDVANMQKLVSMYLQAFKALYGEENMIIKMHYLHHHAPQIGRWGKVAYPNCFALERKHKGVKRYADNVTNCGNTEDTRWDRSVLREITADHVHALQQDPLRFDVSSGLDKARQAAQALRDRLAIQFGEGDFEVARVCRVNEWEKVAVGDAVVVAHCDSCFVGEVLQHICRTRGCEKANFTLISKFDFDSDLNERCSVHRRGGAVWVGTSAIECAVTWAPRSGDAWHVLRPVHALRGWER